MKQTFLILITGILAVNLAWAAPGDGSRIVGAAAANPRAVQAGANAVASRPRAQAKMDERMAANPKANKIMEDVQAAGGYTPPQ